MCATPQPRCTSRRWSFTAKTTAWFPYVFGVDLARRIEGARLVTLAGADHFVWIHNSDAVPNVIEEFLTGEAHAPHDDDRILTTIVFTDIVDSTTRLAGTGDARWRALLAEHDRRMDELLTRFGGQPVKHTGDGRLVHFTRPGASSALRVGDGRRRTGGRPRDSLRAPHR